MNPPSDPPDNLPPGPSPRAIETALQQRGTTPPVPPVSFPPLPEDAGLGMLLDSLLKRPAQLIRAMCDAKGPRQSILLLLFATIAFAFYGLVVGSFSGGGQYLVSPLKIAAGGLLSLLICFPSFYIFSSLAGIEVSLRGLAGVLLAMFTLTALLLLGFAPVAWVFSQSTESVNFIATLHLLFWMVATGFGLRLFGYVTGVQNSTDRIHLKVWMVIFVLVSLQMTTALRPIIGSSKDLLPTEKKFFVTYWLENLSDSLKSTP